MTLEFSRNQGRFSRLITTAKAVGSLCSHEYKPDRMRHFDAIRRNALRPLEPPINTEDYTLTRVMDVLQDRNIFGRKIDLRIPYWQTEGRYNHLDIFNGSIQFLDSHSGALPTTILPPEEDVKRYMTAVMTSDKKLTIGDQLELLLDITNNNILGAANLGFITSRLLNRAADTRAYPSIPINSAILDSWGEHVAQFEPDVNDTVSTGPTDTYYFWTHVFAALAYKTFDTPAAKTFNRLFEHGSETMVFVKRKIARDPQKAHYQASQIGRNIGLAIAELIYV